MGNIYPVVIEDELKNSYMTYAMSVIISRAIPDVRDGLKPVHRRILHSMNEMGLNHNKPYKKCGRIVGDVLGKFHPHGDMAIYDSLVRLAQNFSMRYVIVDGHGNFGSIDGDPPAAMRYTESRMSKIAELLLKDIEKETVDFGPNYDDSMVEPKVLPASIPFLLINGASGIAVGMATNIPPYNLGEVINAITAYIDNPDITIDELMKFVTGPDFPTGGIIYGTAGIKKALKTGRGSIVIRSKVRIEENAKTGREFIVVDEIPYQIKKAELIERIAELVKADKITGISDIRDESDRQGMRIVIELKKGFVPNVVLNQLYSHTNLQINYGIINLALDNGIPKVMDLKYTIKVYVDFRMEVIYRRTRFELRKAEERSHILLGLMIALDNIDEVIKIIKGSSDTKDAKAKLMERFALSDIQCQAILDMRLQKLTSLETTKIKEEYEELQRLIAKLKEIISSDANVLRVVREELIADTAQFIDARRTEIVYREIELIETEDLIHRENMVVTVTHKGFIKRTSQKEFKIQSKGGVGITSSGLRDDDFIEHMFIASTHDYLLFFSNKGIAYRLKVHEIPELSRTARGQSIKMLISVQPEEEISAIVSLPDFKNESQSFFFATKRGVVKRVSVREFNYLNQRGKRAISLDENDEVIDVKVTTGSNDIVVATRMGKSLRYNETAVRCMGRTSRGVRGIKLAEGDSLCGLTIVDENCRLLVITEYGYGKRIEFDKFTPHGRGTGGQRFYKYNEAKGFVAAVKQVEDDDDIIVTTNKGQIIRIASKQISEQGKNASGIRLVRISKPDMVVAIARANKEEDTGDKG